MPLLVIAAVALNFCSGYLVPPTKNAQPKTSNKFDRIEPNIDTCTTRTSPRFRAKIQTITSVTFPKVALRRPPKVSFVYFARSSVTNDIRSANGHRARSAVTNVMPSLQFDHFEI